MKVSFLTLGCRLNQAETAILQQQCRQNGWEVVDPEAPADIVVINTCTVTEHGDTDTRRLIHRQLRLNAASRIALVGCQSQVQSALLAQLPGVHWVIGTGAKMQVAEILKRDTSAGPLVIVPEIETGSFKIDVAGVDRKHTRANLKIQDGCDFFCSYCEIPYARGRSRSRDFNDLLSEAHELISAGHRELVLTGINIGLYDNNGRTLMDVVRDLQDIPDLLRLRISSIEATTIRPELVGFMKHGKLCRFLHLPLQSASDAILEKMHRKYTLAEYELFIREARAQLPEICIGTDVLVGFPGERDDHFSETLEYLRMSAHSYLHVFSYSDRINNRSKDFPGKVPQPVIEKRSRLLRELSAEKRQRYMRQNIGRTEMVLFEQKKNGYWSGVTDTYIRVRVPANGNLHNQLLAVALTDIDGQNMIGRLA
jgi:threonylcarbamoyladenosine tRNA methylthiotransferase MtaB